MRRLNLSPIGVIRGNTVRLRARYREALDGIAGFSHVIVVFWLHEAGEVRIKLHPQGEVRVPKRGFLATRTPRRANPIGLTVARLKRRRGAVLYLEEIDAWDGSPVLDVKPYDEKDVKRDVKVPPWLKKLRRLRRAKKR